MKTLLFTLILSASVLTASAQTYSIDWFKIAGGGGTSTGGVYSVSGTIGQPDAGGPMTNGQYSITGGFWVLPTAVQGTNAPMLTIIPAGGGQAAISWTPATPGFVTAGNLGLVARQLDELTERHDQSHRRPRLLAGQVLSPVQTVTAESGHGCRAAA
ncbi:MAG: hypothetical protein V9H26_18775 [Verrucomicrobiota bacterium]